LKVSIKEIAGNWDKGYALDKHIVTSTFTGHNEYGHATFDTIRTEAGEATFQLKYRSDWSQVEPLAQAIVDQIVPKFQNIGLVIPVPASKLRQRQPVYEVAQSVAKKIAVNSFEGIVAKAAPDAACPALKDLGSKAEKVAALEGRFSLKDTINPAYSSNPILTGFRVVFGASELPRCWQWLLRRPGVGPSAAGMGRLKDRKCRCGVVGR